MQRVRAFPVDARSAKRTATQKQAAAAAAPVNWRDIGHAFRARPAGLCCRDTGRGVAAYDAAGNAAWPGVRHFSVRFAGTQPAIFVRGSLNAFFDARARAARPAFSAPGCDARAAATGRTIAAPVAGMQHGGLVAGGAQASLPCGRRSPCAHGCCFRGCCLPSGHRGVRTACRAASGSRGRIGGQPVGRCARRCQNGTAQARVRRVGCRGAGPLQRGHRATDLRAGRQCGRRRRGHRLHAGRHLSGGRQSGRRRVHDPLHGRQALLPRLPRERAAAPPPACIWTTRASLVQAKPVGHRAVGVPGTVAGMWEAHRRFGKLNWAQELAPAIRYATDGFVVEPWLQERRDAAAATFASKTNFDRYFAGLKAGATFRQPELAPRCTRIAKRRRSRILRRPDRRPDRGADGRPRAGYRRPTWLNTRPSGASRFKADWHGYRVITAPPPSSGGIGSDPDAGDEAADAAGVQRGRR